MSRFPSVSRRRGSWPSFRRSPGVAALAELHAYSLNIKGNENLAIGAPRDSAMGNVVDRVRLIKGRLANPAAPDEVTIGERLAAQTHLRVGSHLDAGSYTQAQIEKPSRAGIPALPRARDVRLRVVGIVRRPLDLGVRVGVRGSRLLTPAFGDKYEGRIAVFTDVLRVKTERGHVRCAACHRIGPQALGRRADVPGAAARHRDRRRATARSACSPRRSGSLPR